MAKIRALFVVFLLVWATSCSTVPNNEMRETRFLADGAVSAEIVEKPSNERYEIRAGEQFLPLPFTQEYRFTFKQENGRAVVVQGSS